MKPVKAMNHLVNSEKAVLYAVYRGGGVIDRNTLTRAVPCQISRTAINAAIRSLEQRGAIAVTFANQNADFQRRRVGTVRLTDMAIRWIETNIAVFNGYDQLLALPYNRRPRSRSLRRMASEAHSYAGITHSPERAHSSNRAPYGLGMARFAWWVQQQDNLNVSITKLNQGYGGAFAVAIDSSVAQRAMRDGLLGRNVDGDWVLTDAGVLEAAKWADHLAETVTNDTIDEVVYAVGEVESSGEMRLDDADAVAAALLDRVVELLTAGEKLDASHALRIEKLEGQLRVAMDQYDRVVTERDTIKANLDLAQSQLAATAEELERIIRGGSRRIRKESLEYLQNISKGA